jgi:hypothetical protein
VSEKDKPLTPDHVKLQVFINDQTNTIQVEFSGFEDCEKYAEFLTNTLPLLLYETKQIQ